MSDIEGLTGVYHWTQTKPGNPAYDEARELLMGDLLAAVEGAHDGGADEIVVYDMHESGRNIFTDRLPAYVRHIAGTPTGFPTACLPLTASMLVKSVWKL